MNKEVQEAIEYLKEDIELYEDCCYLTTEDHMKSLEILLNYIDKLQIENEDLKEEIKLKSIIDLEKYSKLDNISVLGKEYISKDKIRDKIKECEENEKLFAFIQNESYMRKMNKDFIILLKELLEE